jgi:uracil-DNA glycosylase family 4
MQRRNSGKSLPQRHVRGVETRLDSLQSIASDIVDCARCPRLRRYCEGIARIKRRAFLDQEYWARPVPAFGDTRARLWILGLAPAAHGANRTGRMFTGDSSGDWLFAALHDTGFASQPTSVHRADGQKLVDATISAVVRCAPPDNKPSRAEIARCAGFLQRELAALTEVRALLCLGQIAFAAALRLLDEAGYDIPRPRPRFAHAAEFRLAPRTDASRPRAPHASSDLPSLTLLASYHPSRQNTHTGRLTRPMWTAIFRRARALVDS